ncbi:DUF2384 domain-containing protein [Photobacterium sp. ZSDE20]|uniref:DUF2384 domain-containing protein n=1 Tax=Photobacterium pectinilyticum TaxID=2906793 RepID=A0ABT1N5U7_9GAMM|nr:antitoxin Xre/MbcA/ParS toxin-binding domain-containing protein [Photobacterium sp. ZSDE20]MCQ1060113.1 DUF2384 domain-containing protein [Photobacterium sp. ZSDE20]MDD1827569.1 DUF2384 domain-containing protein [Photobacterium sp. ZSDE20]
MTDENQMIVVSKAILTLLNKWLITDKDQCELLGIDCATLGKVKLGGTALPAHSMPNAAGLLNVHKSLRLLYSQNSELLYGWISMKNDNLQGQSPLKIMKNGVGGIKEIEAYLSNSLSR